MKKDYYWKESFGGVDAFSGENVVAIEDVKEASHAPHLLVNVFFQVVVVVVVVVVASYYTRRHSFLFFRSFVGSVMFCHPLFICL